MVIDHLDNASRYTALHPLFERAFEFLRRNGTNGIASGRNDIDGETLYAMGVEAAGRAADNIFLEVHRRYIDIHLTVSGDEVLGWTPTSQCKLQRAGYDEAEDAELFDDESLIRVPLPAGTFAICFPEDAHAPVIGEGKVRKIVMKIAV